VWLGVSVEDQKRADLRIPKLLDTPAAVRFLSCEPLLGPVNLGVSVPIGPLDERKPMVDWVIVGGESGPGARPMHPDWARDLRDQCQDAGVPYFFKQWGAFRWVAGARWDEATQCWEDHGIVPQRVAKKLSGRKLDGRTWDEFPEVAR
jgi:protein gp37